MPVARLVAVVLLLALNGFFVVAEFGLVAVRRTRLVELAAGGNRRAARAAAAVGRLDVMLSGCQLGITFASLGLGWIGEPAFAGLFHGLFRSLPAPLDAIATHGVAAALAFAAITALLVVFGELVPKNLAVASPERAALWSAGAVRAFSAGFRPVIRLLNAAANRIVRLLGVTPRPDLASRYTKEELAIIVREAHRGGTLDPWQSAILTRALAFRDKRAVDAMIPRGTVNSLGADAPIGDVLRAARATGHSRLPVWRERPGEFVGVVHLKDAIELAARKHHARVGDAMREAPVVPDSLPLEDLLVRMQRERSHLAIVVDEFGSSIGIVSLEDILEELVGDIRDEHDAAEPVIRPIPGGYRVPGTLRPDELLDATGCPLPSGEFDTVAGFILERLGRMASRGDAVAVDGWTLTVTNARDRRIRSIDVRRAHAA